MSKRMELATLWLPIIGGILLGGIGVGAWFADMKIPAIWFGFAGVVCLVLLATLQIQDHLLQESSAVGTVDVARSHLRAYLHLSDQKPTPSRENISIHLKNAGQTPARAVRGHTSYWWDVSKGNLPPEFKYPDLGLAGTEPGITMGRDQEYDMLFPMQSEKFKSAERGELSLFIYGHIDYVDAFNVRQQCTFCYKVLTPEDGVGRLQVWGPHNECT